MSALVDSSVEEVKAERRIRFSEFLDPPDDDAFDYGYRDKLRTMIDDKKSRMIVNVNHLREFDGALAKDLIKSPADFLPEFEGALQEVAARLDPSYGKEKTTAEKTVYSVGLTGSFGSNLVSPPSHHYSLRSTLTVSVGSTV